MPTLDEFDFECGCPDPCAGRYEPCEAGCGARVAPHLTGLVEDDHAWGCHPPSASHCHNWTTHTPERCRRLRAEATDVRPHPRPAPHDHLETLMAFGLPLPDDFDATDELEKARVGTSNIAALLRAALNAGEAGVQALLDRAEPYAEWLDGLLGDDTGVPAPPADVPVDRPLDQDEAAQTLGV